MILLLPFIHDFCRCQTLLKAYTDTMLFKSFLFLFMTSPCIVIDQYSMCKKWIKIWASTKHSVFAENLLDWKNNIVQTVRLSKCMHVHVLLEVVLARCLCIHLGKQFLLLHYGLNDLYISWFYCISWPNVTTFMGFTTILGKKLQHFWFYMYYTSGYSLHVLV